MASYPVTFEFFPSLFGDTFPNSTAKLEGSWDPDGTSSENWSVVDMDKVPSDDGGYCYRGTVQINETEAGKTFKWGVRMHERDESFWAIPTEENTIESRECVRSFCFSGEAQTECYFLTHCRRMGANKYLKPDGIWGIRFAVWAPNARDVHLVFGTIWNTDDPDKTPAGPDTSIPPEKIAGGYIADDGSGIHPEFPEIRMQRTEDGIWETLPDDSFLIKDLLAMKHRPYMYRLTRDDGSVVFRSDIYSRCQIGGGSHDPGDVLYQGAIQNLEGRVSCSVALDPDKIVKAFSETEWPEKEFVSADVFWADEFAGKPLPKRIEDLVIYQLHLGALGYGQDRPGTLKDALELLDHIEALNVNAVELLPLSESAGDTRNWGYATSHFFAIEYGGGGRDQFKHFIRECHRRGLAVIMDVVYNHFDHNAVRAERHYDSPSPENDIYYWYEGRPADYEYLKNTNNYWLENWSRGGYVDNMSTGDSPAFHEENVRKMFISSAVALIKEFHIDGFRVDQTTSMHQYNKLRATGEEAGAVNVFGAKFLRELGRTLRLVRPGIFLMAEDHSDWGEVIRSVDQGGMGFDARWYSEYYHHLAGDTKNSGTANLLREASLNGAESFLNMEQFSHALWNTQFQKVVYSESHDEAGNSEGPIFDSDWKQGDEESKHHTSHRTIVVAVDNAPLIGDTRKYAEARSRFAWGVTVLSAGTPMFLFGEEVGAEKRLKYRGALENREDLHSLRLGTGKYLYKFFCDINALRLRSSGLRSRQIEILHVHNENRVLIFRRWDNDESFLVFASLADHPFENGYEIRNHRIESGHWKEVFNSDASIYGGNNIGNSDRRLSCVDGCLDVVIPFAGFVVLAHERNH